MPVDPQIQGLLDLVATLEGPKLHELAPPDARAAFARMTVGMRDPAALVPVAEVEQVALPGPDGTLAGRIYRPEGDGPRPTLVFFHGGGWVIGDLDTHENQCRMLAREAGAVVLSVDYRLAPEAAWPAAVDDCLAALRWAHANLDRLGGDATRLAVGGDSAGGNLAAVVAQQVRDGGPALAGQLLIYPAVDLHGASLDPPAYPSVVDNAGGFFLEAADMEYFRDHYVPDPQHYPDPRVSPLRADTLAGLPPAVVAVAEFDPLRDEGLAYAEGLAEAGVPVRARCFDGMIHGFFDMFTLSDGARAAVLQVCSDLRELLAA